MDISLESFLRISKKDYSREVRKTNLFETSWYLSIKTFLSIFLTFLLLITIPLNFIKGIIPSIFIFILFGIYFHKLSILLHDLSHMKFFPSSKLNILVGNLVAWICFTDFKSYQLNHRIHHLKTGLKDDYEIPPIFKNTSSKVKIIYLLSNIFGLGIFFTNKKRIAINSKFSLICIFITQSVIFILLSVSGNFFTGFFWFLSSSSVGLFLSRLRGLLEHSPIESSSEITTRSHHCNSLEEFIFYGSNMNFHLEHHLEPALPTYHLKKFSKIVNPFINPIAISRSPLLTLRKIASS